MQLWQTEGLFREGHRGAVIPKHGEGRAFQTQGPELTEICP